MVCVVLLCCAIVIVRQSRCLSPRFTLPQFRRVLCVPCVLCVTCVLYVPCKPAAALHLGRIREINHHAAREATPHGAGSDHLHLVRVFGIPKRTARHTSHVTRRTSHITCHTSHVTRHTSHATRRVFGIPVGCRVGGGGGWGGECGLYHCRTALAPRFSV